MQCEQAEGVLIHLHIQGVDQAVVVDDLAREVRIALDQRSQRSLDLFLHESAHAEDLGLQAFQFVIEVPVHSAFLSESSGDVVFRPAVVRRREDLLGVREFNQLAH